MPSCPSCDADVDEDDRFCASCGHELSHRADERRVVTVLFGDIVGYTSMSENADPERVKRVIDEVFSLVADDINSFGGRVDKVVGDGIVALFGAPVSHEDDAERAVRAGLRMQRTIAEFAEGEGIPLEMRIGVNTGEVLVGSISADGDWTAMGDVVNTASRLQTMADPGAVVVGASTHVATDRSVFYEVLGDLDVKGRSETVEAWRAVTVMGLPGQRSRRDQLPLIGRDVEMNLLTNAIDSTFARGRASLVVVAGEAGFGRSRLVDEVLLHAQEHHTAAVLNAPCVPYGEADRWFPIAEAVRTAVGIRPGDSTPTVRAAVDQGLSVVFGVDATDALVSRASTGIMHLLGHDTPLKGIEPERAATEAARAVRAGLQARAVRQPVILAFSDLQWADDVILRLINGLMARMARSPLVIIASATHDLFDRWTPQAGRTNMLVTSLDPLDPDDSTRFVRAALGQDADDFVVAEIVDRGGGNPFFLEELSDLVGSGVASDLSAVPHNVRGVISAKLDSIDPADRELLEHATVLGRRGPVDGLQRMASAHGHQSFAESLQRLIDHDLLWADHERWEIPSNLVHEVTYGRLAKSERARRHAGVATYLEQHGGALQDTIAHHYRRAAILSKDLRSVEGVPDDVVDRSIEATRGMIGTRRASAATRRSVDALTEALELAPQDHPRRSMLLVDRARVLVLARELDRARADLEPVLADDGLDERERAAAELVLGELFQLRGDFDQSAEILRSASSRFADLSDPAGVGEALRLFGMARLYAGDANEAEEALLDALEVLIECKDLAGEAWVRQNLAWMSFTRGHITEAEERIDQAIALFREIGDGVGITWGRGLLAYVRLYEGELDEAAALADEVLAEAEEQGEQWGTGMMLVLLGSVALWSGNPFEAVRRAEEAQLLFSGMDDLLGQIQADAVLGRALIRSGRTAEGRALFDHSGLRLTNAPREGTAELVPTSAAAAFVTLGDPVGARRHLEPLIGEIDDPSLLGSSERHVTSALISLQEGDAASAVEPLQGVIDATGDLRIDTNANSALALAAAADGQLDRARRHAAVVLDARHSSFPDRVMAHVALVVVAAREGDEQQVGEELTQLRRARRAGEDQMSRMLSLMAEAAALRRIGHAEAGVREDDLQGLLSQLGIQADGWRRVFEDALA